MTTTTSTTQDPQGTPTDPPATGDPAAPGGQDPAATGSPDPNSPEGLKARLERRQQALDDTKAQLRAWQALGKTPDELAALLAGPPAAGAAPAAPVVDADAIRREVEAELRAAANLRVLEAELRAAATGRLADPADALQFIALDSLQLGPDGRAHPDDLADAIAGVLERKPYLGVAPPVAPRFAGAAGGGARPPEPAKTLAVQIAEAEAAGDIQTSMRLKAQQLATNSNT